METQLFPPACASLLSCNTSQEHHLLQPSSCSSAIFSSCVHIHKEATCFDNTVLWWQTFHSPLFWLCFCCGTGSLLVLNQKFLLHTNWYLTWKSVFFLDHRKVLFCSPGMELGIFGISQSTAFLLLNNSSRLLIQPRDRQVGLWFCTLWNVVVCEKSLGESDVDHVVNRKRGVGFIFLILLILTWKIVFMRTFSSSVLAPVGPGSVLQAVEISPRFSCIAVSGCTRSDVSSEGLEMFYWGCKKDGAVSGSPFRPTVHVIVTWDVAFRSPIFPRTSMPQIFINHLFKRRTSRLWGLGWVGKKAEGKFEVGVRSRVSLGSGRSLFRARMNDQERNAFSLTHRWYSKP